MSPSRSHKRRHNFSDTPATCECNLGIEDIGHFLFECPFCAIQRVALAIDVIDILQRKNLSHLDNKPELYRCAGIHEAMGSLTNQKQRTSEHHTESGRSRISRDNKDLEEVIEWFDSREPFDPSEHNLKSISYGITAVTDEINCDNVEEIGE